MNSMLQWAICTTGLSFYVYIESHNPKKPRRSHTAGPKPHQLKAQTPKTQYKTPTPKPQTTINEQLKKDERINLGKMKRQKQRISDKMCIIIINLGSDT